MFLEQAHLWHIEFAEYTSAQERIALGKKSRKLEASQRRTAMKELIDDAYVNHHCGYILLKLMYIIAKTKTKRQQNGNRNSYAEEVIERLIHRHRK